MFKKIIITVLLLSSSSFSLAMSCFELNLQTYKKEQEKYPAVSAFCGCSPSHPSHQGEYEIDALKYPMNWRTQICK